MGLGWGPVMKESSRGSAPWGINREPFGPPHRKRQPWQPIRSEDSFGQGSHWLTPTLQEEGSPFNKSLLFAWLLAKLPGILRNGIEE